MKTHTTAPMKPVKTPAKQQGVFIIPAAFLAVGLGLIGIGIDNNINHERTNYSASAPLEAQQQAVKPTSDLDDFFSSME